MSLYDILMMTILCLTILFGLWKGLAWQIASLAAIIASYMVAMQFRGELAQYIDAEEPWNRFAAMLILYLGTTIIVWIIYGIFVRKTIDGLKLRWFDRPAGAIVGAAKGILVCMVITIFSVTLLGTGARDAIMSSKSGGYMTAAINRLDQWMPSEIHAYIDPYVNNFNHKMTEKDPDWIRASEKKWDSTIQQIGGNLKTFHGNWSRSPASQTESTPTTIPTGKVPSQPTSFQGNLWRAPKNAHPKESNPTGR